MKHIYSKYAGSLQVCGEFNRRGLFIPVHPYMKREHCIYAVKCLKEAIDSQYVG